MLRKHTNNEMIYRCFEIMVIDFGSNWALKGTIYLLYTLHNAFYRWLYLLNFFFVELFQLGKKMQMIIKLFFLKNTVSPITELNSEYIFLFLFSLIKFMILYLYFMLLSEAFKCSDNIFIYIRQRQFLSIDLSLNVLSNHKRK